jgi:tetratricopeptide (TPR) repeat protein
MISSIMEFQYKTRYWLLALCCSILPLISVFSQCFNRDSLWKRLIFLRDSSSMPPEAQLAELNKYNSAANDCPYSKDSLRVLLLQRIGSAFYKLGNYKESENFIKSAILIIETNRGKPYVKENYLGRCYYTLSLIYTAQNSLSKKNKAEDSCIAIDLRLNAVDIFTLQSILEKVNTLCDIGDFHGCIQYANEGAHVTSLILHGNDSLKYASNFFFWKISALYFLNEFTEAEKLLVDKTKEFSNARIPDYNSYLFERLASVKTQEGDYTSAINYYNRSLGLYKLNKIYTGYLKTLINMGYYLYDNRLHDSKKALNCYTKALRFANLIPADGKFLDSSDLKIHKLIIYGDIANIYTGIGKYDSAEYFYNTAYSEVIPYYNKTEFSDELNIDYVEGKAAVYVLYNLIDEADGLLKKYTASKNPVNLKKAVQIYALADKLQARINTQLVEFDSRLFWRSYLRRLYEHAIETSYLLNQPNQAFYYFERSRAILLIEQLNKQNSLNKDDIIKLAHIKQKINSLNFEINNSQDAAQLPELKSNIFLYKQELNILEQSIKEHNPLYFQSVVDTNRIHLDDIQKKILGDHKVMLEIFNGDSNVYTLFITGKNSFLNKINKIDFDQSSYLFTSYISDPDLQNRKFDDFIKTSNHLYRLVFGNIIIPNGRLIISPDGRYFPFEALVTNMNIESPSYLLNKYFISYSYSAEYLMNEFSKNNTASIGNLLGVAPIQYPAAFNLAQLSGSDASLDNISSHFRNTKMLVASQASKNNFMQQFYGYKMIQLYTHASDSNRNGEPVIYFADSVLTLSELIPENKAAAQLIMLSACETGNGKLYKGEGVFSFNRGFAALGIPSSVINLWSVENESTYKITELFYKYVADGLSLDVALQKAKLEFIQSAPKGKRLPYYWAAAILAGKTDAIETDSGFSWYWAATGAGFILLCLAFFRIKRKKSNAYSRV